MATFWISFMYAAVLMASVCQFGSLFVHTAEIGHLNFKNRTIGPSGCKMIMKSYRELPRSFDIRGESIHPHLDRKCFKCSSANQDCNLPPRARHCNICKTCRHGYDHHCDFINCCVGETNYPAFVCFVVWAFVGLMLQKIMQVFAILIVSNHWYKWIPAEQMPAQFIISSVSSTATAKFIFLPLLCSDFILGMSVLYGIYTILIFHSTSLARNTTAGEQIRFGDIAPEDIDIDLIYPYDWSRSVKLKKEDGIFGVAIVRAKQIYLNLLFRVWRGPLMSCCGRGKSTDKLCWHDQFNSVGLFHVISCYLVPLWWKISGEESFHCDDRIVGKYFIIPDQKNWEESYDKAIASAEAQHVLDSSEEPKSTLLVEGSISAEPHSKLE